MSQKGSCRCQALTKLELSEVSLVDDDTECNCPPQLREACFEETVFSKEWMNLFNKAAPNLQLLQLVEADLVPWINVEIESIKSLR